MFALFAALIGCASLDLEKPAADTAGVPLGGDGGPAMCVESARSPVDDPSVAADGFSFPASDAISASTGAFAGPLTFVALDRAPAEVALDLARTYEPVEAVLYEMSDGGGGACTPAYEYTAAGTLIAEDLLAQTLAVTLLATAPDAVTFATTIAAEDIDGTAAPVEIETARWDSLVLSLSSTLAATEAGAPAWTATFTWQASNGTAGPTADTGSSSGTVEPSGEVEGWGSAVLTRVP